MVLCSMLVRGLHSCLCCCYFLLAFAGWVDLRLAGLAIIVGCYGVGFSFGF